jgi:hypothetical protein
MKKAGSPVEEPARAAAILPAMRQLGVQVRRARVPGVFFFPPSLLR